MAPPSVSKDEGLKAIWCSLSMVLALGTFIYERGERGNPIKDNYMNVIIEWPLIANTLLQNVTGIITKLNNYFITKYNTEVYYKMSGFLLQNVTV